jgi:hypothetical protein
MFAELFERKPTLILPLIEVALGQLLGLRHVLLVDRRVAPAGDARVEDVRPGLTGVGAGLRDVRLAIDDRVDALRRLRLPLNSERETFIGR